VILLRLCLSEGCDTSPALLCADGCSMIDRRMVGCPPQSSYFCFLVPLMSTTNLSLNCILASPVSFITETARAHMKIYRISFPLGSIGGTIYRMLL
jgi:hypothetical protein